VVADGAGRDVQFLARALEAFMAGGRSKACRAASGGKGRDMALFKRLSLSNIRPIREEYWFVSFCASEYDAVTA